MPTGVIKTVKAPIQVCDAVCDLLGLTPQGPGTPGALFEFTSATDEGFRTISVFNTEEDAKANIDAVMKAAVQFMESQGQTPNMDDVAVEVFDVHAYYTAHPAGVMAG